MEAAIYNAATVSSNIVQGLVSPNSILRNLNNAQCPTPFGRVIFDPNGVNSAIASIVAQVLPSSSTSEIVYPSDYQTATFVYPMPSWDERVYKWSLIDGSYKLSSVIVAAVCSIVMLLIAFTVCLHKKGDVH